MMKKMFLLATMMFTMILSANEQTVLTEVASGHKTDDAMCKLFENKAETYAQHMRDDDYAKATLKSYKLRAAHYCGK